MACSTARTVASLNSLKSANSLKQSPAKAFAKAAVRPAVRASSARFVVSAERDGYELGGKWYPGAEPPSYLDGTMAGDYGFDPLRFGANSTLLPWYQEAELMNGRWAMMAVAGIVFTDLVGLGPWWTAGAGEFAVPFNTLVAVEVVMMAALEYKRIEGFKKTGGTGFLGSFPFDPMGMSKDNLEEMKLKEVKNARAAMCAFIGCCSQAAVRGMGPVESLKFHLADPTHNNIYTSSVGLEFTAAVIVLAIAPTIISTQKSLSDKDEEFRPIPW